MAKKRGKEMKCYYSATAVAATPTQIPAVTDWTLASTVNKVSKSFKNNEYAFETREQDDDIVVTSGRTSEFTITVYCDPSDAFFMKLVQASNAQTTIPLVFSVAALTTADAGPNIAEIGNFSITEEDSDEPKKEGVLYTFKAKPGDDKYARLVKTGS